ncbi:MAG: lytic transglycosylase domain-containing protein [Rickettsiales bacterium]|nr:MAG: lytic transglycosylase domain-containing protein [Rickettsiales bacterium]
MFKIFIILCLCFCNFSFAEDTKVVNLFYNTNKDIKLKLELTKQDKKIYNNVLNMIEKSDFSEAISWASSIESDFVKEGMLNYALWEKYKRINTSDIDDNFSDLMTFIQTHQYLPNLYILKEKLETMYLNNDIPNEYIKKYFEENRPIKTATIFKLLQNEVFTDFGKVFLDYNWQGAELYDFIEIYGKKITNDEYIKKVENLIMNKKYTDAETIMAHLSSNDKTLYNVIIELNKNPANFDNLVGKVPFFSRNNELLLYTKFMYYHKRKDTQESIKTIMSVPEKSNFVDKWWTYQKYYARRFLEEKNYVKAYFLATNRDLKKGSSEYAEAEFLSGWIALQFLDERGVAYKHFKNLYDNVSYPGSKSRAIYWLGRAEEKMRNVSNALKWYEIGSKYSLYFYGQLSWNAKNEITKTSSIINEIPLPTPPNFTEKEENDVINNEIVGLAYLIQQNGGERIIYTQLFRRAIDQAKTDGERSAIFEIIKNTKDEALITNIAKYLSYKNIFFVDNLFPILNMINIKNSNSHLIHAIIKQESGFHITAQSNVGAIGFMQLMPATAKIVAKQVNLKFNQKQLASNPVYNILLGTHYINSLIKNFNGSEILAIASYNAGPGAAKRWIEKYGDPRQMADMKDIIDWIERIEYSETRDYVQKIIENSIVYQYVLEKNNI